MTFAVLFDLDGTLLDTPPLITETIASVIKQRGAKFRTNADIQATIGLRLDDALGALLEMAPDDAEIVKATALYRKLFVQTILPKGRKLLYPGVGEGLEVLHARGVRLAVATSKVSGSANEILTAAGISEFFDLVIGADQVGNPKPHPEMAHRVLHLLGLRPEQAVMVGDTTHDVRMATQAGIPSIAVTYGVHSIAQLEESQPTWLAASFNEALTHIFTAAERATL